MAIQPPTSSPKRAVDSPWLWLAVFLSAAIVVLSLGRAKYDSRQPQIEREYQARQRSGYAVPAHNEPQGLAQPGNPMISTGPLQAVLVIGLVVCTLIFWIQRWRAAIRQIGDREDPTETEP